MGRQHPSGEAIAAAQVPAAGSLNVDHVAHFVPDIDAAAAALAALGFSVTPFSTQSHHLTPDGPLEPAGTGNRCVMLERGYLEILTATHDTPMAAQLRAAMSRYVGVHLIAFGTNAPEDDHARLAAADFEPATPVALQRPVGTLGGEDILRFTVVRVPLASMPEGRIQLCQHRTPQLVWQSRWIAQPNGVNALADVIICAADPAATAARYGRYCGLPTTQANGAWRIGTARGAIHFADPQLLSHALGASAPSLPWIAGCVLETADSARTREYFAQAGCTLRPLPEGRFAVTLPPALGGLAIVQQTGSGPFSLHDRT